MGTFEYKKGQRKEVFDKYNGKCAYCGDTLNFFAFHVDHIIPLKRFKPVTREDYYERSITRKKLHVTENMNPCCKTCNTSKGSKTVEEWRQCIHRKLTSNEVHIKILMKTGVIQIDYESILFYFETINVETPA